MEISCHHCGKKAQKDTGDVNRNKQLGINIYCSRRCSGLGRRKNYTIEEKKAIKKAYDLEYRDRGYVQILKAWRFFDEYKANPEKFKKERQRRMKAHIEYCRSPEYKKYKKKYDHEYKMRLKYGEFWECGSVLSKIDKEIQSKEVKYNQGIINKTQKRKRKWQQKKQSSMPRI